MLSDEEYHNTLIAFFGCVFADPGILYECRAKPDIFGEYSAEAKLLSIMLSQSERKMRTDHMTLWLAVKEAAATDNVFDPQRAQRLITESNGSVPSAANWRFYENKLLDNWMQKRINQACSMILEMDGPALTAQDKIEVIEKVIAESENINSGYEIRTIAETLAGTIKKIEERRKSNGIIGVPTGIPKLDTATYGMQNSQYWIIGARPSQGKSALMGQISRNVAIKAGRKAGVITIESSIDEVNMRSISAESRVNGAKLSSGVLTNAEMKSIEDAVGALHSLGDKLVYHDRPGISIRDVESIARRMKRQHKIEVLFIDYLQLITVPKSKGRTEEVGIVSVRLKALARDLKIPVIALAQLGRGADEGKPTFRDFQHSSQIEQDADVALLLWHYEDGTEDIGGKTVPKIHSKVIIAKARDGLTGEIDVKFDKAIMTFFEVDKYANG